MTWTCVECSTVYSVGAPRCPHCGSTEYVETHMAKITRHGGPSDRRALAAEHGPETVTLPDAVMVTQEPAGPVFIDYASWSRAELLAEAKRRELPRGGSKADLAARLSASDRDRED